MIRLYAIVFCVCVSKLSYGGSSYAHCITVFDHKRHNQYILCHYLAFISRRFESYVILSEHIMANAWHVGIYIAYSMSHLVKCCDITTKVSWYHGCV